MTAHDEAIAQYLDRMGMLNRPAFETVSEPDDPTAGMVRCVDCLRFRGGFCTDARAAFGVRQQRIEIGSAMAGMSQHCAGFLVRESREAA